MIFDGAALSVFICCPRSIERIIGCVILFRFQWIIEDMCGNSFRLFHLFTPNLSFQGTLILDKLIFFMEIILKNFTEGCFLNLYRITFINLFGDSFRIISIFLYINRFEDFLNTASTDWKYLIRGRSND